MPKRVILDLCGGSGTWSRPYREAGYRVEMVDPTYGTDVRLYEWQRRTVHGVLAAPPCTVFAASGARWWPTRDANELLHGLSVVDACLRVVLLTNPVWWALENPIGRLSQWLGPPHLVFQPWQYGDPYTKRTCLWGQFHRPKQHPVKPTQGSWVERLSGWGKDTKQRRSVTPEGFADAFFEANP